MIEKNQKNAILFTSCFGLGKLPIAPGTWGSLPPVVAYQVLLYLSAAGLFHPFVNLVAQFFFIELASWVCIIYSPVVIELTGKKDPGLVVADEVAGQTLTMLMISIYGMIHPINICNTAVLGFLLFRLFDIVKIWPCRRLEKFPAGWGILADDLAAGLYAGILSLVLIRWLPLFQV